MREPCERVGCMVEDVVELMKGNFPLQSLTAASTPTTTSPSSGRPGVGLLCRVVGHASELSEGRKAERGLKYHVNDPEDPEAVQKRKELAAKRNKGRKARRQANKFNDSVEQS